MLIVISIPDLLDEPLGLSERAATQGLLDAGVARIDIRKPEATKDQLEMILKGILPKDLGRVSLHLPRSIMEGINAFGPGFSGNLLTDIEDGAEGINVKGRLTMDLKELSARCRAFFDWAVKCGVQNIHIPAWLFRVFADRLDVLGALFKNVNFRFSAGAHSKKELTTLLEFGECYGLCWEYVLVSPVFNSISKKGYLQNDSLWDLPKWMDRQMTHRFMSFEKRPKLIALGGLHSQVLLEVIEGGFDGAAFLGAIWADLTSEVGTSESWVEGSLINFNVCNHLWDRYGAIK